MNPSSSVEEDILDRFQSLMRHVADSHAPEFLGVDVTMPQAKVLYVVSLRPGIPCPRSLRSWRSASRPTSGLVDRLVASGYLERREDPSDRRQQLVTITPAGAAALDRLRELRLELMRRLVAGLVAGRAARRCETALAALDREAQHLDDPDHQHHRPTRKDARMIRLTQFAVREKSVIILLAVGVLLAGVFSWQQLRQELLPDIEFPFVTIITPVPGRRR